MRIELENIHKQYGPVKANDGISLSISAGTLHGILGENGAGKSTLMKILSGYVRKTDGLIRIDGKPVSVETPAQARRLGIGMLYQDPLDFSRLSVLENFMLGQPGRSLWNKKQLKNQFLSLAGQLGFSLDPAAKVFTLTVGERQQLELLRLLAMEVSVLILDEPTTGISTDQKELLFSGLKKLTLVGKSVVLVSHKLEEMTTLCDRITVLRQGRVSGEMDKPFDADKLLKMMFGFTPSLPVLFRKPFGKEILALNQVSAIGGRSGLRDCTAVIREKEILGLAGLEGSGQEVFLRVAAGLKQPVKGDVFLKGLNIKKKDYHFFKQNGVVFLPGARLEEGLIPGLSIEEHFTLLDPSRNFFLPKRESLKSATENIERFCIKGTSKTQVDSLSGGNQQRLLFSFLPQNPKILFLENPTRGLDLESVRMIWQQMQRFRDNSAAVVFSSSDLDEIRMVADRVLIFFNGRIVKDTRTDTADVETLGRAIAGKI